MKIITKFPLKQHYHLLSRLSVYITTRSELKNKAQKILNNALQWLPLLDEFRTVDWRKIESKLEILSFI